MASKEVRFLTNNPKLVGITNPIQPSRWRGRRDWLLLFFDGSSRVWPLRSFLSGDSKQLRRGRRPGWLGWVGRRQRLESYLLQSPMMQRDKPRGRNQSEQNKRGREEEKGCTGISPAQWIQKVATTPWHQRGKLLYPDFMLKLITHHIYDLI